MTITTKEMHAELIGLFARFDTNGNGCIDEHEFRNLMRALGEDIRSDNFAAQFAKIDANGDDTITFEEFVDWWLDYK